MENSIGLRVKSLRLEHGMTLVELGEKTSMSTSYLSQIERDKAMPSLSALMNLASALGVDARYFFDTIEEDVIVRRADQEVKTKTLSPGVVYYSLSDEGSSDVLQVYRITIQPNAALYKGESFPGEEFCFVISGELNVMVGDEIHHLCEGDSIHYDALFLNNWQNPSDKPCVVIQGRAGY